MSLLLLFLGQERPDQRTDARDGEQKEKHQHRGLDFGHEGMNRARDAALWAGNGLPFNAV